MDSERWRRIDAIYHAALSRPFPEWSAYLAGACRGDDDLRREVESLLAQPGTLSEHLPDNSAGAMTAGSITITADPPNSLIGRRLAHYHILARLGVGGMGEVYRARDTKLGRDVAIKILPPEFTSDPDRLARFEREARVLASFNHPHIGAIYGVEDSGSLRALVLELVEGQTLADRIRHGPVSPKETFSIAAQLVAALDAAHERGIVHRDFKPANIKITPEGVVKVLDFGIAKASSDAASSEVSRAPTVTVDRTHAGLILGTVAYMSPEQARGKPVDKRTDIWAFACVLYEMLTGKRAFGGETITDTVVAIVEREPDWAAMSSDVSDAVVTMLKRCLAKDPKLRLRDIGDFRLEQWPGGAGRLRTRRQMLPWAVAALFAVTAVALGVPYVRGSNPPAARPAWATDGATFMIQAPMDGSVAVVPQPTLAVSRDGRYIAWVGPAERPSIWLYTVANGTTRQLAGTTGASNPFWSPDSRAIGFQSQGMLRTIDVTSGAISSLASNPEVSGGGAWSSANVIVFSTRYTLQAIPAKGGEPRLVATLNAEYQENSLRFPRFLPDGRHFLFVARSGRTGRSAAYVGSIDGAKPTRLFPASSHVEYASPGYLVYVQDEQLVARAFDQGRLTAEPELTTVLSRFGGVDGGMRGHFTLSENGVLAYLAQPAVPKARFQWVARTGRADDAGFPEGDYSGFRLAPDGQRIVADNRTARTIARDVWVLDPTAPPRRVTFGDSDDWQPFWSTDGHSVAWMSYRNGPGDLFAKALDGAAPETSIFKKSEVENDQRVPGDWAPDGHSIAYWTDRSDTRGDVWVHSLDGSKPIAIAATLFNERRPRFSPDGRFLAYESDEPGQSEVFVQPVPPTGEKWQISIGGGVQPSWRRDARELYYVNPSGDLIAVPITLSGRMLSARSPVRLFSIGSGAAAGSSLYDPISDGSRFLVRQVIAPPVQPIMVVLDWTARLRQR